MKKCTCFVIFLSLFFVSPFFCSATENHEEYAIKLIANDMNKLLQEKIPEEQLKEVLGFILISLKKPDDRSNRGKAVLARMSTLESTKDLMEQTGVRELFTEKDIYMVEKGDTLWGIAGKRRIYSDPTKWFLLYNGNRDSIENPDRIDKGVKLKVPLSIYEYYEIYKKLMNDISKDAKVLLVEEFNNAYDEFKDLIIRIICDDLKWCDIELPSDDIRFIIMFVQVVLRSTLVGQVACVVALLALEKGPPFLNKICNCDKKK